MKRLFSLCLLLIITLCACNRSSECPNIAATTLPVYDFTTALCKGTGLTVGRIVTESVSCLHDYTLQVNQMRMVEGADCIVVSGAGLEVFLEDCLSGVDAVIDASKNIDLLCGTHSHSEGTDDHDHEHGHDSDPHIWLSPENAKLMTVNIFEGLVQQYPEYSAVFENNLSSLTAELNALIAYSTDALKDIRTRDLITFHDGFGYLADAYHLHVLRTVEEESGSEASAAELKELITCVRDNNLRAIFVETHGSTAAAEIISAETGVPIFSLNMAMSGESYFDTMYYNINTLKEALE